MTMTPRSSTTAPSPAEGMGLFERFLSVGVALATVVGVLVEVPLMLALVRIANATRHHFPAPAGA